MKKLMFTFALFFSASAFATSLHPDANKPAYRYFSNIAPVSVTQQPLCPEDVVCVTNGTVVNLEYRIPCSAGFVSFNYDHLEKNGKIHLFVNALIGYENIEPPACLAFSHKTETVQLINVYGDVEVHALGVFDPFTAQ